MDKAEAQFPVPDLPAEVPRHQRLEIRFVVVGEDFLVARQLAAVGSWRSCAFNCSKSLPSFTLRALAAAIACLAGPKRRRG